MSRHARLAFFLIACSLPLVARAEDEPAAPQGSIEAARRPLPQVEGDTLRFALLADTHASTEHPENGKIFRSIVKALEAHEPDFAIFAGDCVDGHVSDAAGLERNWEVFDEIAAGLPCPYRLVTGNNDVFDPATSDLWKQRYGSPTMSFGIANARFVCLDGERPRAKGRIGKRGLRLLREAVEGPDLAEHLFVFTHQPWWRTTSRPTNWMSEVHPLLAKHPSAHVFAGHWHHYEAGTIRDGVRYTIVSPAGGGVGKVAAGGEFHACLLVSTDGAKVTVEVLRDGKTLPADVVTEATCARLRQLEEALDIDAVSLTGTTSCEVTRDVRLENVLDDPLELTLAVTSPAGCRWQVAGPTEPIVIEPGTQQSITIRLTLDGDALPLPEIHATGRAGGELVLDRTLSWPARYERKVEAAQTGDAPVVDGVLDDAVWSTATETAPFVTLQGNAHASRQTTLRALWTPEHLYLALECREADLANLRTEGTQRDWGALTDDAVLVFMCTEEGGPCLCVGATASGVPTDFRIAGGAPDFAWNGPWTVKAGKSDSAWSLEMAIPWATLGLEPKPDETFGLGVFRHSVPGGRDLSAWTPPVGGSLGNPKGFGKVILK